MLRVIAGMPAYNEGNHIGAMVQQARKYADEVIVVDDGSTDGTSEKGESAGATVIRHSRNLGKGVAIQRVITEARKIAADVLVLLDADTQHDPNEIPRFVKSISAGYDLVIGSRQAEAHKTPPYRRLGQRILLCATRMLTGVRLTDSESGFRALSAKAIAELTLKEKGFAIETEMIAEAAAKGLKITEIPIANIYTADGSTQNPVRHGFSVLFRIVVMMVKKLFKRKRPR